MSLLPLRRRTAKNARRTRPTCDSLEGRTVLSWVVPPSLSFPTDARPVTLDGANDASGTAAITADEVDYYDFRAPSSGNYVLAAQTTASSLDPVLAIFNGGGQRMAYNDDFGGVLDSQLAVDLSAGRRYFVAVTNYTGSPNGSYTWSIDGPDDDASEDNDTFATARDLGSLLGPTAGSTGLQLRDDDWYRFTTSAGGRGTDSVRIDFSHAQGDVDLALYDAAGAFLASSTGVTDSEVVSLSGRPAGTYYVRVYGYAGARSPDYSLAIEAPPAGSGNRALYINFDGAGIPRPALVRYAGSDWSGMVDYFDEESDGILVSPFLAGRADREAIISQVISRVQGDLDPFGISVIRWTGLAVEDRGVTTIFAGPSTLSNGSHIACDIDYFNNNVTDIAFVNDEDWGSAADTATAMADVFLHEAGHTFGLHHVDTLQDGVLYNESMGLRYSTPDQGRWLADTGFTNRPFAEYLNHGGGRGPQNSYQTMLRNFPTGGGAPAFLGPEPPATPGRWLEEELGLHRHRPGGYVHGDGRSAHHTTDLAIDRLVPKDAPIGELAVEVTRERFDRPGADPGEEAAAAGGIADGGRFTGRIRPRPESRSLASSSIETGWITDLGPHQAPPEGRAPAPPDPAVRSGGSDVDPIAINVIPRRPGPGRPALVRRVV